MEIQSVLLLCHSCRSFQWGMSTLLSGYRRTPLILIELLAYGIAHMDGIGGYGGWRWIFILGGLFTVAVASVSWLIIPDWPETAKFLNSGERSMLLRRLAEDKGAATMDRIDKASTKRVFKDSKIYLAYEVSPHNPNGS